MILFKKWGKRNVKSYIYCVNQFLQEKRHKKWSQECIQKQLLLFNFCNIFDLLISRTGKIAWWPPVFKYDFYIFSYNEQLNEIKKKNYGQVFIVSYLIKIEISWAKKDVKPSLEIWNVNDVILYVWYIYSLNAQNLQ